MERRLQWSQPEAEVEGVLLQETSAGHAVAAVIGLANASTQGAEAEISSDGRAGATGVADGGTSRETVPSYLIVVVRGATQRSATVTRVPTSQVHVAATLTALTKANTQPRPRAEQRPQSQ